jgi:D-glycero-D-manno-heptose 1,7-bisphosphate phosphatase
MLIPGRAGVFLDRDGTIIRYVEHLTRTEQVRLLPRAAAAIARLNRAGCPVVVVTNQSVVARGLLTELEVQRINDLVVRRLARRGARVDVLEYCPHHPQGAVPRYRLVCDCRKPAPGMLLRAAKQLGIDLQRSLVVGDNVSDVEMAWAVGARVALLQSGLGRESLRALREAGRLPDLAASSLWEAVDWWLTQAQ